MRKFEEIIKALDATDFWNNYVTPTREERLISWQAPPEGWILLNTDGASKGNPGPAGGGGVFRGFRGEWLCGFSENIGSCTSV